MLTAPKAFASLSSGLLARKGQARPAMRRQMTLDAGDDLGWNDMGEPLPVTDQATEAPLPPVLAQREELAETLDAPIEAPVQAPMEAGSEPTVVAPVRAASVLLTGTRRAAFTLRLDPDRHLRLRLASATRGLSAQRLVTQALDDLLKTMPEVEALATSVPATNADRLGD